MKIEIVLKYRSSRNERDVFVMLQQKKFIFCKYPMPDDSTLFHGSKKINKTRLEKYWPDLTISKAYNCNEN